MMSYRKTTILPAAVLTAALAASLSFLSGTTAQAQGQARRPTSPGQRSAAYKPSTAMDALASLSTYLGPRSTARVVTMTAEEGRPEPLFWEIILLEPSAATARRVLRAGGGQVFYDKTPLGLPGNHGLTPVLNINKLKLDSGRAFKVAEREAAKARIAFNHANYELFALDPESAPIWIVTLIDDRGDTVGKVDVNSLSGDILRSVWNPNKILPPAGKPGQQAQGPGPRQGPPGQSPPPPQEDTGGLEGVGRRIDRSFNKLREAFN